MYVLYVEGIQIIVIYIYLGQTHLCFGLSYVLSQLWKAICQSTWKWLFLSTVFWPNVNMCFAQMEHQIVQLHL